MSDPDTQLMADAFNSITNVLAKIHSEFKTMAYSVVFLLVLTIAGCTCFLMSRNSRTEERLMAQQERLTSQQGQLLDQLRKLADGIHMNQNVNVNPPRTPADNAREILQKQGFIERDEK